MDNNTTFGKCTIMTLRTRFIDWIISDEFKYENRIEKKKKTNAHMNELMSKF